jgi:phage terminase large subunit
MLSQKQKKAIQLLENDPNISEVFFGGAAGVGKSFVGVFWQIVRRLYNPGTRGFMGRNTYMEFKTTTFKTFYEVWNQHFKNNPLGVSIRYNSQDKTVYFSNGSEIIIKDLSYNASDPEFNDLGGLELTDAFIDEVPGITQKAKNIIYSRIRFRLVNNKAPLLMTGNPTDNWVKHEFVCDKMGKPIELARNKAYIGALLTDNPDPEFVKNYRRQLLNLPHYDQQRLLYGDWNASEEAENPFMHSFNPDHHVGNVEYNANLPVFLSVDFNVNPLCMIAAHVFKEGNKVNVQVFKEFEIKRGSIPLLIDTINQSFPTKSMIRLTGDAGGVRGDIRFRDNITIFDQILKDCNFSIKQLTIKGNPQHNNSRADCNKVLSNPLYDVKIDRQCYGLVRDMRIVNCDSKGHIIKSNRKNVSEQADFLDTFRYLIHNFVPL